MGVEITYSARACILLAAAIFMLPLQWIGAVSIAAVVHELCHLATMYILDVRVNRICVDIQGAIIETEPIPEVKELLIALAGPAGSFLLVLFYRKAPLLAFCGLVQGLYNLIPIYPMDGGRALRSALIRLLPRYWEQVYRWVRIAVVLTFVILLTYFGDMISKSLVSLVFIFLILRFYGKKILLHCVASAGTIEKKLTREGKI